MRSWARLYATCPGLKTRAHGLHKAGLKPRPTYGGRHRLCRRARLQPRGDRPPPGRDLFVSTVFDGPASGWAQGAARPARSDRSKEREKRAPRSRAEAHQGVMANSWRVFKFGGSSVADAACMRRVADIIEGEPAGPLAVVLSACKGVTDGLLDLVAAAERQEPAAPALAGAAAAAHRHRRRDLHARRRDGVRRRVRRRRGRHRAPAPGHVRGRGRPPRKPATSSPATASCGPRGSSPAASPPAAGAARCAGSTRATSSRCSGARSARRSSGRCRANAPRRWCQPARPRRSSCPASSPARPRACRRRSAATARDFSASIFGDVLNASEIHIWTDVDGVLSADPRRVPDATRDRLAVVPRGDGAGLLRRQGDPSADDGPGGDEGHPDLDAQHVRAGEARHAHLRGARPRTTP